MKAMIRRLLPGLLLPLALFLPGTLLAQVEQSGNIAGEIRIAKGDFPTHQILLELRLHGGTLNSVYADMQGHFGFDNLQGNTYHIVINDEAYDPVDQQVVVSPYAPNTFVQITLRPREPQKTDDPLAARALGGNPYLVDPANYNQRFPKKAVKEYQRGVDAEHKGKRDEAIAHYEGALKMAPDYYPAHNNLGSLYLSKSNFQSAEAQFRESVRLDQNDAQAYFNLGNVLMLTGRYAESEAVLEDGLRRRPDSAFTAATVRLKGLNPAFRYTVEVAGSGRRGKKAGTRRAAPRPHAVLKPSATASSNRRNCAANCNPSTAAISLRPARPSSGARWDSNLPRPLWERPIVPTGRNPSQRSKAGRR